MDSAQLHLVLNHVPVIGTPCAAGILAWGLVRRSRDILRVGCGLAIVVAASTYGVFLTGEPAERRVEDQPWFQERVAHQHEDRAELALTAALISGLLAALTLWGSRGKRQVLRWSAVSTLAGLLLSAGLLGWTARVGGAIRHDKIRGGAAVAAPAAAGASAAVRDSD